MKLLWLSWFVALCLSTFVHSLPLFGIQLSDSYPDEPPILVEHKHHKHHHKKHRRRSLSSKEDSTKLRRNKQIMLTKPYWPWP